MTRTLRTGFWFGLERTPTDGLLRLPDGVTLPAYLPPLRFIANNTFAHLHSWSGWTFPPKAAANHTTTDVPLTFHPAFFATAATDTGGRFIHAFATHTARSDAC